MSLKVGQEILAPRVVLGGVPQGSILGVFLFNVTSDCFEAASDDVVDYESIRGKMAVATTCQPMTLTRTCRYFLPMTGLALKPATDRSQVCRR